MMRAKLSTCALLLALSYPLQAATTLPTPGMSMQAVENQFGAPRKKNPAVGHPPITRWEYDGYVVVFEHSTVIESIGIASPAPGSAPAATATPAPAPVPAPAATASAAPTAATPAAPETSPPPAASSGAPQEQEAMAKAAAEKAAAEKGSTAPAEDTSKPKDEGYTFDPATGRIIIKQ